MARSRLPRFTDPQSTERALQLVSSGDWVRASVGTSCAWLLRQSHQDKAVQIAQFFLAGVEGPAQEPLSRVDLGYLTLTLAEATYLASRVEEANALCNTALAHFQAAEHAQGQIRRFTGNDYADDLASGNVVIAQAYSGDVVQLQKDNPDLKFVVPETGGTTFVDTMVIPYTTQNQKAAEEWINYVYDRPNYAKLIAHTQYVPVLSDMSDELNKIDPKLASNPLINPPKETLDKLKTWAALTDEQTQEFNKAYATVTGG